MIETKKKLITTQLEERSIVKAICDQCSKELPLANEEYCGFKRDSKVIHGYISLSTYHHGWGNDSGESAEAHEFCSMKCCLRWITEHKEELENDSREFEIECHGTY